MEENHTYEEIVQAFLNHTFHMMQEADMDGADADMLKAIRANVELCAHIELMKEEEK